MSPSIIAPCEVSRKYGPVLYLRFGIRPVVLVSSTSAAEECFTKNDITFANRPTLLVGKLLNYNSTTLPSRSYEEGKSRDRYCHVGDNRLMDDLDVAQQPYLRCIIKETLRLHPPTPLLLHHYSSEDCTVGGFRVLRRTMLLVNVWALHHDPCIWTEPEKFMPERFEGMEGTKDGLRFLPFGSGRRKYPGESLAIASVALALVLQCFDWEKITS
nr:cytochrome P450 81F4-like [Coffea arabica]